MQKNVRSVKQIDWFKIELKPILPDLYKDHLKIYNALRSKNPDKVEEAFIQHNEKVLDRIKEDIEMEAERIRVSKKLRENHFYFSKFL